MARLKTSLPVFTIGPEGGSETDIASHLNTHKLMATGAAPETFSLYSATSGMNAEPGEDPVWEIEATGFHPADNSLNILLEPLINKRVQFTMSNTTDAAAAATPVYTGSGILHTYNVYDSTKNKAQPVTIKITVDGAPTKAVA